MGSHSWTGSLVSRIWPGKLPWENKGVGERKRERTCTSMEKEYAEIQTDRDRGETAGANMSGL